MPFYRLARKFDDGTQVHPRGTLLEFPASKEYPNGLAPSTATLVSDDELLAEQRKESAIDAAAERVAKERMKEEIKLEMQQEAKQAEAKKEVAGLTPPADPIPAKQKAT